MLSRHNQIALILSVLIIYNNNDLAVFICFNCVFYLIEFFQIIPFVEII